MVPADELGNSGDEKHLVSTSPEPQASAARCLCIHTALLRCKHMTVWGMTADQAQLHSELDCVCIPAQQPKAQDCWEKS